MSRPALHRRLRPLLGTFVEVAADREAALTPAFAAIEEVQRLLSFHDPASDLSRLNRSQGEWVRIRAPSATVLRRALMMMRASDGLFNCTVGGELVRRQTLPDPCAAHPRRRGWRTLTMGRADDLEVQGTRARLRRPVLITLDGIAKGYAVDRAVQALRRQGARAGWVNAGGDVRAFGRVALPLDLRERDGKLRPLGSLQSAALASSAVFVRPQARFPGHIVAAQKSRPTLGVWSVLATTAWRADALTKVAALAPASERAATVRRLGGRLVS